MGSAAVGEPLFSGSAEPAAAVPGFPALPTLEEVCNAEHDLHSAALLLTLADGIMYAEVRLAALHRALREGDDAAVAAEYDRLAAFVRASTPSDDDVRRVITSFADSRDETGDLPACAACGVRALPGEGRSYERCRLRAPFMRHLRYTSEQQAAFSGFHPHKQRVVSSFLAFENGQPVRFHLHPELVDVASPPPFVAEGESSCAPPPLLDAASALLCPLCLRQLRTSRRAPTHSIANGYDYGVLKRALPADCAPSMVEKLMVSLVRTYAQVLKLKGSGGVSGGFALLGHAISFAHDAANVAAGAVAAQAPLMRAGVLESLRVTFGPQPGCATCCGVQRLPNLACRRAQTSSTCSSRCCTTAARTTRASQSPVVLTLSGRWAV